MERFQQYCQLQSRHNTVKKKSISTDWSSTFIWFGLTDMPYIAALSLVYLQLHHVINSTKVVLNKPYPSFLFDQIINMPGSVNSNTACMSMEAVYSHPYSPMYNFWNMNSISGIRHAVERVAAVRTTVHVHACVYSIISGIKSKGACFCSAMTYTVGR